MSIPVYVEGEESIEVGYVSQSISEIEMEIAPAKAPSELTVDVKGMEIGDSLTVADIDVPEDAEILDELEATVLSISAPDDVSDDLEQSDEGETEADMPEPEVITEKEDEEEDSEE